MRSPKRALGLVQRGSHARKPPVTAGPIRTVRTGGRRPDSRLISLEPFQRLVRYQQPVEAQPMIDQTQAPTAERDGARDDRSMRVMEYAMAFIALAAALLISIR